MSDYNKYSKCSHNHEIVGSVETASYCTECHSHRFAAITGEEIYICNGEDHIHEVAFTTDTYEGHNHEFCGRTGGAVWFGDRHVHYIKETTESENGHVHTFKAVTLINDPTSKE